MMRIYEIKRRTAKTVPYFFSRKTMDFFGQTLKDFTVKKQSDGRYEIYAPVRIRQQKSTGRTGTKYFFNPVNDKLELE